MGKIRNAFVGLSALVLGACSSAPKVSFEDELNALAKTETVSSPKLVDSSQSNNLQSAYEAAKIELSNDSEQERRNVRADISEEVDDIAATMNSYWKSQYLAQGFRVTKNPVVQTDITLSSGHLPGFALNLWGSYNPETDRFTEIDATASYSRNLTDNIVGTVSAAHFDFSFGELGGVAKDAQTFALNLRTADLPVNASITATQVFGHGSGHGRQYNAELTRCFDLTKVLGLEGITTVNGLVSAGASYNDRYFVPDHSGFSHAYGSAGVCIDLGEGFTLSGSYLHQLPLDKSAFPKDTFQDTNLWSIGLTKQF